MFEETACFDPNSISEGADDHAFSQTVAATQTPAPAPIMAGSSTNSHTSFEDNIRLSMEELSYHQNPHQEDDAAVEQHLGFDMENCYNINNNNININTCNINNNTQLMPEMNQVMSFEQSNWDASVHEIQGMTSFEHPHNQDQQLHLLHEMQQNGHHHPQSFNSSTLPDPSPYINNPPTQHLLNLFHLPRCSPSSNLLPNSSISFVQKPANFQTSLGFLGDLPTPDNASASSVLYDPLFHLNLPPQPPLFRDLFQSLPNGYNLPASRTASLFGGGIDEREGSGGVYQNGDATQFDHGVLEFTGDIGRMGKRRGGKLTKQFTTESQRRDHLNGKFKALRSLVPNPTKVLLSLFLSLSLWVCFHVLEPEISPRSLEVTLGGNFPRCFVLVSVFSGRGGRFACWAVWLMVFGMLWCISCICFILIKFLLLIKKNKNKNTQDLNLFHLPRCSPSSNLLPNSSISFVQKPANFKTSLGFLGDLPMPDNASASSILYDPLFHSNLPPQPPLFRDLFQSLPSGYNLPASRSASLFGGGIDDQKEGSGCVYQNGDATQFDNGVLKFTGDIGGMGKTRQGKLTNDFATERQRRDHVNGKFMALRSLVPSPSKICEGSSVYASAIANKLIEVVDRQYEAIPPTGSF
nr:basic helix-loop-helix transcription factor [Loropetalum chinense var. rubrum]